MMNHTIPTIAIMLGDVQSDYSSELLSGFYTCAKEEHVNIVFLMGPQMPQSCNDILTDNFHGDYNYQFDTVYDYANFVKPDALIITYGSLSISQHHHDKAKFIAQYANIPTLIIEDVSDNPNVPYLIADNYSGMRECIEHLVVDHGYRKIAFLSGPRVNRDSKERLQAYLDVMAEHNLPVTDEMIAYGDYSDSVDHEVNCLLDNNPGLEAIAFANDNMAKAGYRVCSTRDLLVGHDIAITGFDDVDTSKTMEPPLTSISHSSFQFSYLALHNALLLAKGNLAVSQRMPSRFRKRCSCGCSPDLGHYNSASLNDQNREQFLKEQVGLIADEIFSSIPYETDRIYYSSLLHSYFDYIYITVFQYDKAIFSFDPLIPYLRELALYPHISNTLLLEKCTRLIHALLHSTKEESVRATLTRITSFTQQYVHSMDLSMLETQIMDANRRSWFVPFFTRDLSTTTVNFKDTMLTIMERLKLMNVTRSYFFFFDEPVIHSEGTSIVFPDHMNLLCYYTSDETVYFDEDEQHPITYNNGIHSLLTDTESHCYTSFVLFSGDEQYGLMLCEMTQKDLSFLQFCCLQLGSLFRYIRLNAKERQIQQELSESLKVISEQNRLLSFMSEYDDLSQLLNRRGFMAKAMQAIVQNPNQKACLLFCDVDHLKEINDCFGHVAGDYAICTAADRLRACLPPTAVISRIGGDEFVALVRIEDSKCRNTLLEAIKTSGQRFNAASEMPYYIDISVGFYEFCCSPDTDLLEILKQSDAILYEEKSKRRTTIKK